MRVLVTGADGYIGARLVPYLLARGHAVVGLDTCYYGDGRLYPHDPPAPAAKLVRKDIRSIRQEDVRGCQAVVHLAELSNDPLGELRPRVTYEINHRGSVRLAELCKRVGVERFVYTSSCSVYGTAGSGYRTETSGLDPQTIYAHCKILVERDVSALADDRFSPTFLRNSTVYGPSPRMRFDLVVNNLSGLAWTRKEIRLTSDGTPWRPLVHILDVCGAIACALEAPRDSVHDQIFNVGDTLENFRVRDIAAMVADTFPNCAFSIGSSDGDNRSYRVSFDKIHEQMPGFRGRYDAAAGILELRELFERVALTADIFEFRSFTRLRQLRHLLDTEQLTARLYWRNGAEAARAVTGS